MGKGSSANILSSLSPKNINGPKKICLTLLQAGSIFDWNQDFQRVLQPSRLTSQSFYITHFKVRLQNQIFINLHFYVQEKIASKTNRSLGNRHRETINQSSGFCVMVFCKELRAICILFIGEKNVSFVGAKCPPQSLSFLVVKKWLAGRPNHGRFGSSLSDAHRVKHFGDKTSVFYCMHPFSNYHFTFASLLPLTIWWVGDHYRVSSCIMLTFSFELFSQGKTWNWPPRKKPTMLSFFQHWNIGGKTNGYVFRAHWTMNIPGYFGVNKKWGQIKFTYRGQWGPIMPFADSHRVLLNVEIVSKYYIIPPAFYSL